MWWPSPNFRYSHTTPDCLSIQGNYTTSSTNSQTTEEKEEEGLWRNKLEKRFILLSLTYFGRIFLFIFTNIQNLCKYFAFLWWLFQGKLKFCTVTQFSLKAGVVTSFNWLFSFPSISILKLNVSSSVNKKYIKHYNTIIIIVVTVWATLTLVIEWLVACCSLA